MLRTVKEYSLKWHKCIVVISITLSLVASISSDCSSNPCMYGICVNDPNSSYRCYCIDGYTGINCEINWDDCWSNPCLNGGTCNDAIASYNCTCVEGFVGLSCELKFSECMNDPCLNNGTCVDHNGFTCHCLEGYSGEFCEIDIAVCNDTICKNNGECVEGPGLSFACRCLEGWTGRHCEEDVNECLMSPCQNGGLCINEPGSYICACLFGFTGKECEKKIVPCRENPCQNQAVCLFEDFQPVCYCVPDYHGSFCELKYDDCESKNAQCSNGGTCVDGVNSFSCACPADFSGESCSIPIDHPHPTVPLYPEFTSMIFPGIHTSTPDSSSSSSEVQSFTTLPSTSTPSSSSGSSEAPFTHIPESSTAGYFTTTEREEPSTVILHLTTEVPETTILDLGTTTTFETRPRTQTTSSSSSSSSSSSEVGIETTLPWSEDGMKTSSGVSEPDNEFFTIPVESRTPPTPHPIATDGITDNTEQQPSFTLTSVFTPDHASSPITESSSEASSSSSSSSSSPTSREHRVENNTISYTSDLTSKTEDDGYFTESPSSPSPPPSPSLSSISPTSQIETSQFTIASTSEESSSSSTFESISSASPPGLPIETSSSRETITDRYATDGQQSSVPALDTDYDETVRNDTSQQGFSYSSSAYTTEMSSGTSSSDSSSSSSSSGAATPRLQVITMLPAPTPRTPPDDETTTREPAWDQLTSPETAHTIATVTATLESDLVTLTEFYKTTFPTDFSSEGREIGASPTPEYRTTQPQIINACTRDQCANLSLCLQNATQCDCSYQNNCKKLGGVENAAFNGKSYIRQKFMIDNGLLTISVRLKTKAKNGILIHALFDDERYILLYVEAGQLKFQFSCGLQTMLFGELDSPINNGFEVDVEIRFHYIIEETSDACIARLLVNNSVVMSGEQVLQAHGSIPQYARLHLGGIPVAFTHQFPQIVLGFIGCMRVFKINGISRDFIHDSVEAVQIEECDSFLCLSNPCKNFGACQELHGKIKCKCIAGYSGDTCEKSICDDNPCHLGATCLISPGANFLCICPLGMHGLYCEKDTTIMQPSFSIFSPGFSSYMAYGISTSLKDSMELKLRIIPQTLDQISLIAYMGQTGPKHETSDHFSITYVRGYIMLTWDLGSGVRRIFTNSPLNIRPHKVHNIQIGRRGRDSWLYVEGIGNVTGKAAGTNTRLDVSPILYIGGHKSRYFEILPHDLPLHTGFSGCIYDIQLHTNGNVFPLTTSSPATGRGVGECHRNECSHHSCKNGAVCLNYGPTYSCICMKDWEGPDCSSPINCTFSDHLCHRSSK